MDDDGGGAGAGRGAAAFPSGIESRPLRLPANGAQGARAAGGGGSVRAGSVASVSSAAMPGTPVHAATPSSIRVVGASRHSAARAASVASVASSTGTALRDATGARLTAEAMVRRTANEWGAAVQEVSKARTGGVSFSRGAADVREPEPDAPTPVTLEERIEERFKDVGPFDKRKERILSCVRDLKQLLLRCGVRHREPSRTVTPESLASFVTAKRLAGLESWMAQALDEALTDDKYTARVDVWRCVGVIAAASAVLREHLNKKLVALGAGRRMPLRMRDERIQMQGVFEEWRASSRLALSTVDGVHAAYVARCEATRPVDVRPSTAELKAAAKREKPAASSKELRQHLKEQAILARLTQVPSSQAEHRAPPFLATQPVATAVTASALAQANKRARRRAEESVYMSQQLLRKELAAGKTRPRANEALGTVAPGGTPASRERREERKARAEERAQRFPKAAPVVVSSTITDPEELKAVAAAALAGSQDEPRPIDEILLESMDTLVEDEPEDNGEGGEELRRIISSVKASVATELPASSSSSSLRRRPATQPLPESSSSLSEQPSAEEVEEEPADDTLHLTLSAMLGTAGDAGGSDDDSDDFNVVFQGGKPAAPAAAAAAPAASGGEAALPPAWRRASPSLPQPSVAASRSVLSEGVSTAPSPQARPFYIPGVKAESQELPTPPASYFGGLPDAGLIASPGADSDVRLDPDEDGGGSGDGDDFAFDIDDDDSHDAAEEEALPPPPAECELPEMDPMEFLEKVKGPAMGGAAAGLVAGAGGAAGFAGDGAGEEEGRPDTLVAIERLRTGVCEGALPAPPQPRQQQPPPPPRQPQPPASPSLGDSELIAAARQESEAPSFSQRSFSFSRVDDLLDDQGEQPRLSADEANRLRAETEAQASRRVGGGRVPNSASDSGDGPSQDPMQQPFVVEAGFDMSAGKRGGGADAEYTRGYVEDNRNPWHGDGETFGNLRAQTVKMSGYDPDEMKEVWKREEAAGAGSGASRLTGEDKVDLVAATKKRFDLNRYVESDYIGGVFKSDRRKETEVIIFDENAEERKRKAADREKRQIGSAIARATAVNQALEKQAKAKEAARAKAAAEAAAAAAAEAAARKSPAKRKADAALDTADASQYQAAHSDLLDSERSDLSQLLPPPPKRRKSAAAPAAAAARAPPAARQEEKRAKLSCTNCGKSFKSVCGCFLGCRHPHTRTRTLSGHREKQTLPPLQKGRRTRTCLVIAFAFVAPPFVREHLSTL